MITTPGYCIESFKTSELQGVEVDRIVGLIHDLYVWFAPDSTTKDMHKRLHQDPETHIDLLINTQTGQCDGFSVYHRALFEGNTVMFRGGTVVRHRSRGHYKLLLGQSMQPGKQDFVTAMTQNPRVYETLRSYSPKQVAFPNPDNRTPDSIKRIGLRFCRAPGLDPDTLTVRGVYASIRKDKEFKTGRDPQVARMFSEYLGPIDGFFVVVPTT